MGGDEDLAALAGIRDQLGKRWQQVGMEAGLGLVERQERGRAGGQERCDETQIPQRSVR